MGNLWLDLKEQNDLQLSLEGSSGMELSQWLNSIDSEKRNFFYSHRCVTFSDRNGCETNKESSLSRLLLEKSPAWTWWFGIQPGYVKDDCIVSEAGILGLMLEPPEFVTLDEFKVLTLDEFKVQAFQKAVEKAWSSLMTFQEFLFSISREKHLFHWFVRHRIVSGGCRLIPPIL